VEDAGNARTTAQLLQVDSVTRALSEKRKIGINSLLAFSKSQVWRKK
jgi:hypothetical protein